MFGNKRTILFITKSKIKIVNVNFRGKPKEEIIASFDWTPDTLPQILLKYKKNIKEPVRILLGEEFVYTVNLSFPSEAITREDVKKRAQGLIPENLDETVWDFRKVGEPPKIQVVAVAEILFGVVISAIVKAGIHIEAIEPLSVALARFAQKEDKAMIFVYINDGDMLATLVQKGIVLATEHMVDLNARVISQFIKFSKDRSDTEVKDVIFCGNTSGIDIERFRNVILSEAKNLDPSSRQVGTQDDMRVEIQNVNPVISLAQKEDIRGKDEEVLNLQLSSFWGQAPRSGATTPESLSAVGDSGRAPSSLARMTTEEGREANQPGRLTQRWKGIIFITVITVIIIIVLAVAGFVFLQSQERVDQNIIKPTQNGSPR